ncbi:MAG: monovalent cation/H+ antiporter complex subunit F [Bacillota bacterium]
MPLVERTLVYASIALVGVMFVAFYRAVVGPTPADRIVAINVIGTKAVLIMTMISFAYDQKFFLDVSLVYTLISFLATLGLAKYLEKGSLG